MGFHIDKEMMMKYAKVSGYLWGGAIVLFLIIWLLCECTHEPPSNTVISPDGSVSVELKYSEADSNVGLDIFVDSTLMLSVEKIGLMISDQDCSKVIGRYEAPQISHNDSSWTQPWGENKVIRNEYNRMTAGFKLADGSVFTIEIRVYDDGIGWRYSLQTNAGEPLLQGETTEYLFPTDGTCWSIPANFESYEFEYREQPISQTTDANTPYTFRLSNGFYGSIHEAGLEGMPEMTLVRKDSLRYGVWLAPSADSTIGYATRLPSGSITTSWRTLTIGRKAVDLPNSSLILNLNEPTHSQLSPKPIKYIGVWWGMHLGINSWTPGNRHGATTKEAIRHIDFAAAHNIQGVLFEGWNLGWEQWGGTQEFDFTHAAPDFDLEQVVAYAHQKGIEIIMHHETGGNIPNYERQMEEAFKWCNDHGIHYVKTGYAGGFPNREIHHSRYGVEHYNKVMRLAERYGICLDVHEPIKPTGLCRTYPNLMTAEGARGMEWNAWSDGNSPEHTCTLPFTRLLAGPMDYTPGIFDITYQSLKRHPHKKWNQEDASECRVHTTLAKQVALWTVLYSPMVMASDLIENYEGHPMFGFFEDYDPDIEWSRYLDGEIGRFLAVVRKSCNKRYFIGVITDREARDIEIVLDFLPEGSHEATLYLDGDEAHYDANPTAYRIERRRVTSRDTLAIHLAPGGGMAAVIK